MPTKNTLYINCWSLSPDHLSLRCNEGWQHCCYLFNNQNWVWTKPSSLSCYTISLTFVNWDTNAVHSHLLAAVAEPAVMCLKLRTEGISRDNEKEVKPPATPESRVHYNCCAFTWWECSVHMVIAASEYCWATVGIQTHSSTRIWKYISTSVDGIYKNSD